MTDSKAPWLARGSAIALMMAAGIALAACSGGESGLNENEEATLQLELELAEARAAAAEEERRQAELEEARAEEREAAAERQRLAAEQRAREAEADREAAEEERDELQDQITQIDARYALDGLRPALRRQDDRSDLVRILTTRTHANPAASVVVEPRHGMTALITPTPSWGFSTAQRSSSGGWTVTRHTNSGHDHDDELVVYDNRGGPVSIPLVQEFRGRNCHSLRRYGYCERRYRDQGSITDCKRCRTHQIGVISFHGRHGQHVRAQPRFRSHHGRPHRQRSRHHHRRRR